MLAMGYAIAIEWDWVDNGLHSVSEDVVLVWSLFAQILVSLWFEPFDQGCKNSFICGPQGVLINDKVIGADVDRKKYINQWVDRLHRASGPVLPELDSKKYQIPIPILTECFCIFSNYIVNLKQSRNTLHLSSLPNCSIRLDFNQSALRPPTALRTAFSKHHVLRLAKWWCTVLSLRKLLPELTWS